MPIYAGPSLSVEPVITVGPWLVVECNDGQRYVMGYRVDLLEGRVSTPIEAFDRSNMTVKTRSGRTYHLEGPPGLDADALYVWNRYAAVNELKLTRDVTDEYYEGWQGIDQLIDSRAEMLKAAMASAIRQEAQEEAQQSSAPTPSTVELRFLN